MDLTKTQKLTAITLGVLLLVSLTFNVVKFSSITDDPACPDYGSLPMNTLSVSLIHDMVDVYRQKQGVGIERELGNVHTRNIVFDLPSLKQFIYQIESETKQQIATYNLDIDEEDLGVRIYYSAYPEDIEEWDKSEYNGNLDDLKLSHTDYASQHTLLLVPTLNIGDKDEPADFNPLDIETYANGIYGVKDGTTKAGYNYFPNSLSSIPGLGVFQSPSSSSASSSNTMSKNHGSLYPPKSGNTLAAFD